MPKHEFEIMLNNPIYKERFDDYKPQKYNCIVVDDNLIEPILNDLAVVDFYWHTLQRPHKGLAYWGITLIPPKSMDALLEILYSQSKRKYHFLISLSRKAKEQSRYIIHFGI